MTAPVRRWLGRLWPGTVASRVAMLSISIPLVFLTLLLAAHVHYSADTERYLLERSSGNRIPKIVQLIDGQPAKTRDDRKQRLRLIDALDSSTLRVALRGRLPDEEDRTPEPAVDRFIQNAKENAKNWKYLNGRMIVVYGAVQKEKKSKPGRLRRVWFRSHDDDGLELLPSRRKVVIAVRLLDPRKSWLIFGAATEFTMLNWAWQMTIWIVGGGLFVVLPVAWVSRRMTKQIRRFADAADRIGRDAAATVLPGSGPTYLRPAIRVINRMQGKVEDRALVLAGIAHDI